MKNCTLLLLFTLVALATSSAVAEQRSCPVPNPAPPPPPTSWIFQPSYYTHEPAHSVQVGPPENRADTPCYAPVQGYFSGSNRWTTNNIPSAGGSSDITQYYESWFTIGGQR
ncbi:MAG TPA: hypothetical protein VFE24_14090 [Pirellulales bacterium]|jgi:hypothetical protein|nr:hypothetical protein [Pirellulales bacterium]